MAKGNKIISETVGELTPEQQLEALKSKKDELTAKIKDLAVIWKATQAEKKEVQAKITALYATSKKDKKATSVEKMEAQIVALQAKLQGNVI